LGIFEIKLLVIRLRWWYGSNQRAALTSVIWHLCKQPVDRLGKDPLNQKT
jgi:hypothetical protein